MEIYIDKLFIDRFWSIYDSENDTHRNLRKLLKSGGRKKIYFDFDFSSKEAFELAVAENPLLEEITNLGSVMLNHNYKLSYKDIDFQEKGSCSKYFFTEDAALENAENDYGWIVSSTKDLEKLSFLFTNQFVPLNKTKSLPKDWDFIKDFKHPFNSMVITDNYLWERDIYEIERNLIKFLKNIVPRNLKIAFHLTLIGQNTLGIDMSQRKIDLEELLKDHFQAGLKLSIIPEKVHDRNVFTNYFWINSGSGFSIFYSNKKLKHNSVFMFFPITYQSTDLKQYINPDAKKTGNGVLSIRNALIEECKKINRKETASVGDKNNRLLSNTN
jgi:hypothetical protein